MWRRPWRCRDGSPVPGWAAAEARNVSKLRLTVHLLGYVMVLGGLGQAVEALLWMHDGAPHGLRGSIVWTSAEALLGQGGARIAYGLLGLNAAISLTLAIRRDAEKQRSLDPLRLPPLHR